MNKAYMTHFVCWYPSIEESRKIYKILSLYSEYIEIQFPFSDPLADWPTIYTANFQALKNWITTSDCFKFIENIGIPKDIKLIIMTYYQIASHYWMKDFLQLAQSLWVYGIIIPDIPFDSIEWREMIKYCLEYNICFIPVVAPNCSDERLWSICSIPSKLIYVMSSSSTTGTNNIDIVKLSQYIQKIRKKCKWKKIAVWFWVQTVEERKKVLEIADIVVMGSVLINKYKKWWSTLLKKFLSE